MLQMQSCSLSDMFCTVIILYVFSFSHPVNYTILPTDDIIHVKTSVCVRGHVLQSSQHIRPLPPAVQVSAAVIMYTTATTHLYTHVHVHNVMCTGLVAIYIIAWFRGELAGKKAVKDKGENKTKETLNIPTGSTPKLFPQGYKV